MCDVCTENKIYFRLLMKVFMAFGSMETLRQRAACGDTARDKIPEIQW